MKAFKKIPGIILRDFLEKNGFDALSRVYSTNKS